MSESIYLLSPGESEYSWAAELLTKRGRLQVLKASRELVKLGLGNEAYLLSSDQPSALQTADIIAGLLETEVIASPNLRLGSESTRRVKHLGEFLVASLIKDAEIEPEPGRSYIAVVHPPLISSLKNVDSKHVMHARVEEFPFDTGDPNYVAEIGNYVNAINGRPYKNW